MQKLDNVQCALLTPARLVGALIVPTINDEPGELRIALIAEIVNRVPKAHGQLTFVLDDG